MNGIHPKERRKEGRSSTETPSLDGGMDGPEWTSPARMAGDGTAPDLTCMTGSQQSLPAIIRLGQGRLGDDLAHLRRSYHVVPQYLR
mmetsp:Transcript_23822/g.34103  ORF Transcript_23822/g.34103 Transcript_23822/m.34103 type:complete len:87 (+) Transcript_23822:398-658(+)